MEENIKKNKSRKKLLIIIAAAVIILAAAAAVFIALSNSSRYDDYEEPDYYETEYVETTENIAEKSLEFETGPDEFVEAKIESTPVKLSAESLKKFERFLADIHPVYEYSDYYHIDEALKRVGEKNITEVKQHKHDVRVNGELDYNALYKLVLKNNKEFLKSYDKFSPSYEKPGNGEIKEICERICEVLTEYAKTYPEIDMDTVCCNLYDLKILNPSQSFEVAYLEKNNIFFFSKKQIKAKGGLIDTEDPYTSTLYHEMVHFCQVCCDCYNNGDEWRVGIGNDYADTDTDALCWYWLNEASAEKIMSKQLGIGYTTYTAYIGYLTSLDYIAQLDKGTGANTVELLTLQHDVETAFKLFDMQTPEERLEFIKMMYTVEVLQTKPDGFYKEYEEKYGVDLDSTEEIDTEFRLKLKDDAFITMSKLFYRNLARQIKSGNTTLQDMLYLIRVWENKLDCHCSNDEYAYMAAFKQFYDEYMGIQNKFFALIAAENGLTSEELTDSLLNYSINITDNGIRKSPNCDLAFFDSEEKKFITDLNDYYYKTGNPSIRECVDLAKMCEEAMNGSK